MLAMNGGAPALERGEKLRSSPGLITSNTLQLATGFIFQTYLAPAQAQQHPSATDSQALYRQSDAPIERRVEDLLRRMTLEEKVRQLDLYSGATALVDKQSDSTHAAPDAVFLPGNAQRFLGEISLVGGIHDL
jgi:beta-glucosidase